MPYDINGHWIDNNEYSFRAYHRDENDISRERQFRVLEGDAEARRDAINNYDGKVEDFEYRPTFALGQTSKSYDDLATRVAEKWFAQRLDARDRAINEFHRSVETGDYVVRDERGQIDAEASMTALREKFDAASRATAITSRLRKINDAAEREHYTISETLDAYRERTTDAESRQIERSPERDRLLDRYVAHLIEQNKNSPAAAAWRETTHARLDTTDHQARAGIDSTITNRQSETQTAKERLDTADATALHRTDFDAYAEAYRAEKWNTETLSAMEKVAENGQRPTERESEIKKLDSNIAHKPISNEQIAYDIFEKERAAFQTAEKAYSNEQTPSNRAEYLDRIVDMAKASLRHADLRQKDTADPNRDHLPHIKQKMTEQMEKGRLGDFTKEELSAAFERAEARFTAEKQPTEARSRGDEIKSRPPSELAKRFEEARKRPDADRFEGPSETTRSVPNRDPNRDPDRTPPAAAAVPPQPKKEPIDARGKEISIALKTDESNVKTYSVEAEGKKSEAYAIVHRKKIDIEIGNPDQFSPSMQARIKDTVRADATERVKGDRQSSIATEKANLAAKSMPKADDPNAARGRH